jgi:IclR family mhp operon transcriptional activator
MEDSYSRENYNSQFISIGVPIQDGEKVFGSMNIIYLRSAMTLEEARDKMLAPLQEVAHALAVKLGSRTAPSA